MNIRHMEYFVTLAREQSFSKASERLGITQPTLTQSLQKLENVLGAQLFERSFAPLTLSEEGKIFLEACVKMTDLYKQAVNRITEVNQGLVGSVRVGVAPFRAQYAAPEWHGAFHAKYPNVKLCVEELVTEDMFPALDSGELDFVLTALDKKPSAKYVSVPVASEEVLVAVHRDIAAKNGALASAAEEVGIPQVDLTAFDGMEFILLGEEQLLGRHFRSLAEKTGIRFRAVTRCTSIEASLALADAGAGAALLLSSGLSYYKNRFPNLRCFSVRPQAPPRTVCILYRKNQYLPNPAKYLIELIGGQTDDPRN